MIEVESLHHHYRGAPRPSLDAVSFRVERGQVFGVLGPSGAGKSTLQKLMIKLLAIQRGSIRYDGRGLGELGRDFFERVGVSFEHPNLFPRLSGRENLTCLAGLYRGALEDPDALLDAVGLGDARDKPAGEYSKGMKQRLVVLRALMHRPEVLFLDEPLSGLDPTTGQRVRALLDERRRRGVTIVLTTHSMTLADELCDVVAFLHDGAIVAMDSPRALKLRHGDRHVVVESREGGQLLRERFALDGGDDAARLHARLAGPGVETVHSQEATLEQIFLKITGRGLA